MRPTPLQSKSVMSVCRLDDAENPVHELGFARLQEDLILLLKRREATFGCGAVMMEWDFSKRQIETRLLRSGSNDRPEFRALEREAATKGFSVSPHREFGIGLLSYFMLADRVEFETKRSEASRDSGSLAWAFATEGVASFGELKKAPETNMVPRCACVLGATSCLRAVLVGLTGWSSTFAQRCATCPVN